ncbi:MAG TPA: ABC transporter ATP-binding protein [Candidatus Polarisedimenticolia bacterium]|jgi:iron complex transport system ATP-binding protein
MIEALDLRFGYLGTPLFDGISMKVEPGEMTALIGPNGSGKTTLLRLLSGALRPASGEVRLGGRKVADLSARERARLVAVVPQESSATFDFTAMETVLMGRTAYLSFLGVEGPEDIAAAREAMERTTTLAFAGRLLSHLSGGERQLVVIARALAQRPRALLLDEPTAFLDIRHRLEIYELLARLNREEGLTIVTTSHDINLAARYCRRIVLIKEGSVRADGPPERVFDPVILSQVYETPLRVMTDAETGLPYTMPPPGGRVTGGGSAS